MPPFLSLTDALLTGRLEALPEETLFLFARCGLVHALVGPGLHLGVASSLASIVSLPLCRALPYGRLRDAAALAVRFSLLLWLAGEMGWGAPVVRGFVYVALLAAARLLRLESDRRWLFVLSLLASALLARAGPATFLLSASAFAGTLFFRPRSRWARALGPWLFSLPVSLVVFRLFSPLAPLYNATFGLALAWIALPLTIAGRLAERVGLPSAPLARAADTVVGLLTGALERCDGALGGALWVRPWPCALLSLALLGALALRRPHPRIAPLLALVGLAVAVAWPVPELAALDVGQGDALFLRTGAGDLLEDAGPPGFRGRSAPAALALEAEGRGPLDDIALSHFDLDHRGGLDSLLARHAVRGALWFREEDLNAKNHERVLLAAERARVPIRFLREAAAPAGLRCWLAPFAEGNDSCPLCRATLRDGATVLLTGDMGADAEAWYLRALTPFPHADYLKVAHHGSKGSSSEAFLAATGARAALVSVGARNRYGHPAPETLARLAGAGMRVHRTDRSGSLVRLELPRGAGWIRRPLAYFSFLTEESIRPPEGTGSWP